MIAIPVIKVNQSNTAPTESQLKLAISQVLSLPTAYNAPVIVLDFNVGDDGLVTGRFRDAARPRVFTYEIDDDGIAFKPFTPGRMDSLNVTIWESFSEGYTYRIDAVANKSKSRRQCVKPTAYNCGKSCININKTCKVNPKDANSSMRRKRLKAVIEEFKKSQKTPTIGGGSVPELKPEPVKPLIENKLTSKTPKPKLIGDGTHDSVPRSAQEYYDMMTEKGREITKKEAEETIQSVKDWSDNGYGIIRENQRLGIFDQDAENIDNFIKNSTPYKGKIYRGMFFDDKKVALNWLKGDKDGILDNQSAHASWTSDLKIAKEFSEEDDGGLPAHIFKKNKNGVSVIVSSKNKTGASIRNLSTFNEENERNESEVIVSKGTRHRVVKVTDRKGVILVEVEEV